MPRIRTIKPEFWTNEQVIELSVPARLLFIGSWNFCDDRGVMPASLKALKAKVLPADDYSTSDIQDLVSELLNQGLFGEFEAQDASWWFVTGWKHQKIDRPSPSKYPEPPSVRRSADSPLPSEDGAGGLESRMPRAHSSADSDSPNEDSSRMSPSHSTADDKTQLPVDDDSSIARRSLDDDSTQGEERRGKEKEWEGSAPEPPGAKRAPAPKGCRITVETLPGDWAAYCREKTPDIDPDSTFEDFRDYWRAKPGKDGVKADWLATWQRWCRKEQQYKSERVNGSKYPSHPANPPTPARRRRLSDAA